jgi:outer membrane protein OmpA-like peptidoglycan-associated protein
MVSAKFKACGRADGGRLRFWARLAVLTPLLAACSATSDWPDPSEWFEKDPAPTRVGQNEAKAARAVSKDYPNLSSVPDAAPKRTSTEERAQIEENLVADRANAQYSGERLVAGAAAAVPRQQVPQASAPRITTTKAVGESTSAMRLTAPIPARAPEPPAVAAKVPDQPPPPKPPAAKPARDIAEPAAQPAPPPQSRAEPDPPQQSAEAPARAALPEPTGQVAEPEPEQPAMSQALTELQATSAEPLETAAGPAPEAQGADIPSTAPVPEPATEMAETAATEPEPEQPVPSQALVELQATSAEPLETAAGPAPETQSAETLAEIPKTLIEPELPPPAPGLLKDAEGQPVPAPEPAATAPSTRAEPSATQTAAVPPPSPAGAEKTQILFATGETELTEDAKTQLLGVAGSLLEDESARIQLTAFAKAVDSGSRSARRLSLSRAIAIRAFLVEQGIESTRMYVRALGDKISDGPADRVDILRLASGQ